MKYLILPTLLVLAACGSGSSGPTGPQIVDEGPLLGPAPPANGGNNWEFWPFPDTDSEESTG